MTSSDSESNQSKILQDILARKQRQQQARSQPWKETYVAPPGHQPASNSPHDKPWLAGDVVLRGDDGDGSEYDTSGGQA